MNTILIKNFLQPICISCKHFRINPYVPHDLKLGYCSLFGKKNVVTGEISHEYASSIRIFECKNGKRYEQLPTSSS
jgi:hypothetical protein